MAKRGGAEATKAQTKIRKPEPNFANDDERHTHGRCVPEMTEKPIDLSSLGAEALIEAWVASLKGPKSEHIGRHNRQVTRSFRILDLLKARTDGTLGALKPLLANADLHIRFAAAMQYRTVDRDAYLSVMRELAQRKDGIASEARSGLEEDERERERKPYVPSPEQQTRMRERLTRRALRPPPPGRSRDDIAKQLRAAFPSGEIAAQILALARAAIGLWPQALDADASPTSSRIGGLPEIPVGWSWPVCNADEPLLFLAQIDCAELAHLPAAAALPRSGRLVFFGDHDWANGCCPDFDPWAVVHYWPETLALHLAEPPVEDFKILPSCALKFFETVDLPHPLSDAIVALDLDKENRDRYSDIREAVAEQAFGAKRHSGIDTSKMFGWPDLVQCDLEQTEARIEDGWHLLLQLGNYENGSEAHGWGPGGNLYFMIRDADLAAGRYDRCEVEMQCT